jgi:hypothetical protein
VTAPDAAPKVVTAGGAVVIVQSGDFVCCTYKNCGTLRPLGEVADRLPCSGCGRV